MKKIQDEIADILREAAALHAEMAEKPGEIAASLQVLLDAMSSGGTLYVMGNGGSAADAQHLAGELVGRFEMERPGLPCVALTTDTSVLTSVGNDYGMAEVFARQVQGLVEAGDVVMGISTSGNSENVLKALREAQRLGAVTVGLTGAGSTKMSEICDSVIRVPCEHTPRIQEVHATIIHVICRVLERELSDY
jgi:D-sedoheptulose 7-phosphate isomerase